MKIWKDIVITWNGEQHTIKPTLEFINHLESFTDRSLTGFIQRVAGMDIPVGWSCSIVAGTLQYAGVKVTVNDVYEKYSLSPQLTEAAANIVICCLPTEKQEEGKTPAKKKQTTSKRTGAKSMG